MENKMNWLIEQYNNGTIEYLIRDTKENKGTIVAPTGFGKSGVMIADAISKIDNLKDGEKLILHFATPILKLGVQFMNDLNAVISVTHKAMCNRGEIMFFVNNSDDGRRYDIEGLNSDVNRFQYDINKFKKSDSAKVALVISCFDSIYKFAEQIDYLNEFASVATYIDEAHLIVHETRDDKEYEKLNDEGKKRWNNLERLCEGKYIYALTATPDKYVTTIINKSANKADLNEYIINVNPRKLIAENIILPVNTYTCRINNDSRITSEHCIMFMEMVKADNPNINHKILVTSANTDHLRELREILSSKGYKVFSTCSRDGGNYAENDELIDIDEVEFINEVDSYNGDCFVIHIKQLRQGIDIKSITDIIMYNSTRVNDGVKRTILQTIGRSLRPAIGERGMDIEHRTKKHSNAMFLVGDDDYETVQRQMFNFIIDYYGVKGVKAFANDVTKEHGNTGKFKGLINPMPTNTGFGDDYFDVYQIIIEQLVMEIKKYILSVIKPRYDFIIKANGGKPNKNLIPIAVADIKKRFALYDGENSTSTLLTDTEFMDAISKLFEEYEIK